MSAGVLSSARDDDDGGLSGAIRASGSEQSNPDRAPPHAREGSRHAFCRQATTKWAASQRDRRRASMASEAINSVPPMGFEPMLERV